MRDLMLFFLNKHLKKQSGLLWFQTSWWPLWRHCNGRSVKFAVWHPIFHICLRYVFPAVARTSGGVKISLHQGAKTLETIAMSLFGHWFYLSLLQWPHNERDGVSNHQPHDCLLSGLFEAQIKENFKALRYWPLWGEFTGDRWIPRTKGQ